jgi:hypothetical protein
MGEILEMAVRLPGEGRMWHPEGASGGDIFGQMKGGMRLCLAGRADVRAVL